jgi:hypothetical protein
MPSGRQFVRLRDELVKTPSAQMLLEQIDQPACCVEDEPRGDKPGSEIKKC